MYETSSESWEIVGGQTDVNQMFKMYYIYSTFVIIPKDTSCLASAEWRISQRNMAAATIASHFGSDRETAFGLLAVAGSPLQICAKRIDIFETSIKHNC